MKTIIFLGTPQMSADLLEEIIKDNKYKVVGVISQPDKPLGRKKILTPSPVSMVALKYNIPLHRPEKLNNDYEFIERLQPDLLLTFAYGQLISTKVLSLSKYQALNLHGSLLPKYRGAAPIQYALKNGDKKTGVCLMAMVKKMDAGAVYGKVEISIDEEDNYTFKISKENGRNLVSTRSYLIRFKNIKNITEVTINDKNIKYNYYYDKDDFIVEVKNLLIGRNLEINIKGKDSLVSSVSLVNEEIKEILYDINITTKLKEQIDKVLFSDIDVRKKRIAIRKLKRKGLDNKYIKIFINLLEYIQKI